MLTSHVTRRIPSRSGNNEKLHLVVACVVEFQEYTLRLDTRTAPPDSAVHTQHSATMQATQNRTPLRGAFGTATVCATGNRTSHRIHDA